MRLLLLCQFYFTTYVVITVDLPSKVEIYLTLNVVRHNLLQCLRMMEQTLFANTFWYIVTRSRKAMRIEAVDNQKIRSTFL